MPKVNDHKNLNAPLSEIPACAEPFSESPLVLIDIKRRKGTLGELGQLYETKTLMLILYQACEYYELDFYLNTNVEGYGDFDDIIFACKEGDSCVERIYVQLKHNQNDNAKIYFDEILYPEGNYSLYAYFLNYVSIKNDLGEGDKYFIIYTNADFNCKEPDEKGYRLHEKSEKEYFMFKKLDTSACKALAVLDSVQMKKDTNFTGKLKKNPAFYQFSEDSEKCKGERDRVKTFLKEKFLKLDEDKKKLQLCEEKLDNMLENFLKVLVFAVDQYDALTLGDLIKEKLKQKHPYYSHHIYIYTFYEILLWKNRKSLKAPSLTKKHNYFKKGNENSENFQYLYPVLEYERELKSSDIKFTRQAYENIKGFITSGKQLWHISSTCPWLNSLLIHKAFDQVTLNYDPNINYNSPNHHILLTWDHLIKGHPFLLSLFENMDESVLVIACTSDNSRDTRLTEIVDRITSIVSESQKSLKRVILIAPNNNKITPKLMEKLSVFSDINFDHLTEEAQRVFISNKNIRFQGSGELVSMQQLMGLKEESLSEEIKKLNLDTMELEKLIKDPIVEIGNDQPELSELESMHFKIQLDITTDELCDKIKKLQDIFVFVGTDNDINMLHLENEKTVKFESLTKNHEGLDCFQNIRFIILERDNKEDEQFKQLCRLINRKFGAENVVQPTIHLLKKGTEGWTWMRSYSRDLYIKRNFKYSHYIDKIKLISLLLENSLMRPKPFGKKSNISNRQSLSDFIMFSDITEKAFLVSLDIDSTEVQDRIRQFVEQPNEELGMKSQEVSFSLSFNKKFKIIFEKNEDAIEEYEKRSTDTSNFACKSVHWLKAERCDDGNEIRFQWYCSKGQINNIRSILDKQEEKHVSEDKLAKCNFPIIGIAGDPGMGKSTALVHMAEEMKQSNPSLWIIKIDLNRQQEILAKTEVKSAEKLIALLSQIEKKFLDPLTHKILRYKLTCAENVLFLCDGFDEVKYESQEAVLNILKFMREKTAATIWVTTRPHYREKLEENLSLLFHSFQPIDEKQQINFLSHFWLERLKLKLSIEKSKIREFEDKLKECYAPEIIKKFRSSIQSGSNVPCIIGIILQARMLAEVYQEMIEKAVLGNEMAFNDFKLRKKIDIRNLYENFIEKKFEIYFYEKNSVRGKIEKLLTNIQKTFLEEFEILAKKEIFGIEKKKECDFDTLSQIGLIQGSESTFNFIHRSFAEYFAGKWLADACSCVDSEAGEIIREKLLKREYHVLRSFFDYFMCQDIPLLRDVLEGNELDLSNMQDIDVSDRLGRTALHLAAQEGRVKMIDDLQDSRKMIYKDDLQKRDISLVADKTGKTPLHYAAAFDFDVEDLKRTHVDALLKNVIDIDLKDHIFSSPLPYGTDIGFSIFKNSDSDLVKAVNKRDDSKKSALEYAAENEHWSTACVFVLHGADIRFLTEEQTKKLLSYAANHTHVNVFTRETLNARLNPLLRLLSIHVSQSDLGSRDKEKLEKAWLLYFTAHGLPSEGFSSGFGDFVIASYNKWKNNSQI